MSELSSKCMLLNVPWPLSELTIWVSSFTFVSFPLLLEEDVVVFDERGSDWLNQCIPQHASTLVVPTKIATRSLCRLSFLLSILKWLFVGQYGKLGIRGRLVCAYFVALIEKISPIAVISNNDGSEIIRAIGLNHKEIFVAVVQLALRERYQNVKIKILPA